MGVTRGATARLSFLSLTLALACAAPGVQAGNPPPGSDPEPGNSGSPMARCRKLCSETTDWKTFRFEPGGDGFEHGIAIGFAFMKGDMKTTLELLQELGIRQMRFATEWALVEQNRGTYNWRRLDQRLQLAARLGANVLLTIKPRGPDWACDGARPMDDLSCSLRGDEPFEAFVQTLFKRLRTEHPGVVNQIQFGNEWAVSHWYKGTKEDFVRHNNIVYDRAREILPDVEVVLGGMAVAQVRMQAACEGAQFEFRGKAYRCSSQEVRTQEITERIPYVLQQARYDVVDVHLYQDPENWGTYLDTVRGLLPQPKPLIVSEFSGPDLAEYYGDAMNACLFRETIRVLERLGPREVYYFRLGESKPGSGRPFPYSGLIRRGKGQGAFERKPVFSLVAEYNKGR